ncbi:MAG: sulfotransferase [Acidimicrobiia bacterium]|jgi:hypothetical protein
MPHALVHIGTHKTGTSSLQRWADENRDALLRDRGIHVYEGRYSSNHLEFVLLCMRRNRTIPATARHIESLLDEWRDETRRYIGEQVAHEAPTLLVSAEALSLLRHPDEVEALARVLAPRDVTVAVCLRDPATFLKSYRDQLERMGQPPSRYPSSHAYVEPDSWLVRWDEMLAVWRSVIGADRVVAVGYEDAVDEHGSTIPGVLDALGVDLAGLPSWEEYRDNPTSVPATAAPPRPRGARRVLAGARRKLGRRRG